MMPANENLINALRAMRNRANSSEDLDFDEEEKRRGRSSLSKYGTLTPPPYRKPGSHPMTFVKGPAPGSSVLSSKIIG